ncbi:MAG: hypothetical protein NTX11_04800 [Candidatus Saccharibacteria bacterium]|nr:hypothetical protein [Candidatus Saccharibacteria bacterium]
MEERQIPIRGYGIEDGATVSMPPHPRTEEILENNEDFEMQAENIRIHEEPLKIRVAKAPRRERIKISEPRTVSEDKRFPGVRRAAKLSVAVLAVMGAVTIATDMGLELPDFHPFGRGHTELTAGIKNIHSDVTEYSGIVSADINSTLDINLVRTLHHPVIADCVEKVSQNNVSLSGILVAETSNIRVSREGNRVKASVTGFAEPKLGLPLDEPLLSEAGASPNLCKQKHGKEKKDSPENVPVLLAGQLLKATSQRIGECIINKANDDGSDIQKLLSISIANQIASSRQIDRKLVDVSFDFQDSDGGIAEIKRTIDEITKSQKATTDAKVTIDMVKVSSCEAQDITAVLTSDK